MKQDNLEINKYRVKNGAYASNDGYGNNGAFQIYVPGANVTLFCVVSDGRGWDHVSVSRPSRCPKWDEMQYIKDLFFQEEETVVQFHPKKSQYINNMPYCLHLWRKQDTEYELPPREFVGVHGWRRDGGGST